MRRSRSIAAVGLLLAAAGTVAESGSAGAAGGGRLISSGSVTVSTLPGLEGVDGLANPEFPVGTEAEGAGGGTTPSAGKSVDPAKVVAAGAELKRTFAGLNHRNNRLANGGNQFSLEPPDQALCVGPNHVVEAVNDVFRVFAKDGTPATGVLSLNQFFGYAPVIVRPNGPFGPFITDPVCHYDADTGRYFLVVLTLDQDAANGQFTGTNHLDIGVSQTSDPTGAWTRYSLAVQNDGTGGTPNHHCDPEVTPPAGMTNPSACIGDYPHIGADATGIYLTTNEYSFFSDGSNGGAGYTGSQIYAISKRHLAAGAAAPNLVVFESPKLGPFNSFTVWPAISPGGGASTANGGTEYFLSSTLGDGSETGNTAASEKRIGAWAITNTASLDSAAPALKLTNKLINADKYALPPKATQKPGDSPLRDCLNDTADTFGPGVPCGAALFGLPPQNETLSTLDSSDTRMQQVVYANGMVWGSLGTAITVKDRPLAGVLWVGVQPTWDGGKFKPETKKSGYVGLKDNSVTYPAIGVSSSGKVVMAATVSGDNHYPSAAYVVLNGSKPTLTIASEGVGPTDGFSGTVSVGGGRTRWGDYGAVAMDGATLWLASESIEQTCNFSQWLASPIGSCGGTRTTLANWGTRITALQL